MVRIEEGLLITGIVDKKTVGAASGGLIHIIWNECGPDGARRFLTECQKVRPAPPFPATSTTLRACYITDLLVQIVNHWLMGHGFTVGIQDGIASGNTLNEIRQVSPSPICSFSFECF